MSSQSVPLSGILPSTRSKRPASSPDITIHDPNLCVHAVRLTTKLEKMRGVGYLIVGLLLMVGGSILMGCAGLAYPPVLEINTHEDVRAAFAVDKRRDAMFGSGIALLTTGALMFFGFGCTAVIAGAIAKQQYRDGR